MIEKIAYLEECVHFFHEDVDKDLEARMSVPWKRWGNELALNRYIRVLTGIQCDRWTWRVRDYNEIENAYKTMLENKQEYPALKDTINTQLETAIKEILKAKIVGALNDPRVPKFIKEKIVTEELFPLYYCDRSHCIHVPKQCDGDDRNYHKILFISLIPMDFVVSAIKFVLNKFSEGQNPHDATVDLLKEVESAIMDRIIESIPSKKARTFYYEICFEEKENGDVSHFPSGPSDMKFHKLTLDYKNRMGYFKFRDPTKALLLMRARAHLDEWRRAFR